MTLIDSADAFGVLTSMSKIAPERLKMRETGVRVAAGPAVHALDGDGALLVLIPLTGDDQGTEDIQSRGVTIRTRTLIDGEQRREYLQVRCEVPALATTFAALCDDLLTALADDPSRPTALAIEVLDRWRDLLGPPSQRLLSEDALLGLLAELRFLELVVGRAGPTEALKVWTGPSSARQDFTSTAAAVEVKGCASRNRVEVEIHGLRQLEASDDGTLFLWVERMERVPDGGDSVPDAVERLSGMGISRLKILRTVEPVGYRAADEDAYRIARFRFIDRRAFVIGNDFPRLVPGSLAHPERADLLTKVRYTIDLTDTDAIPGHLPDQMDVVTGLVGGVS